MKITILGSGSAYGCPMVFNHWRNAVPDNPKNERTRASIYIEEQNRRFIIDAGPDFRQQVNKNKLADVDAVFITHSHYDHIAGIPELPRAAKLLQHSIEIWASEQTTAELQKCYGYLFLGEEPESENIRWKCLPDDGVFNSCGIDFETFKVPHHHWMCSAFRCNDFVYITDWENLPVAAQSHLTGAKTWVVECNNGLFPENNGHSDLEKVIGYAEQFSPQKVVLTHLSARVDYEQTLRHLPKGFELAYDGLTFEI